MEKFLQFNHARFPRPRKFAPTKLVAQGIVRHDVLELHAQDVLVVDAAATIRHAKKMDSIDHTTLTLVFACERNLQQLLQRDLSILVFFTNEGLRTNLDELILLKHLTTNCPTIPVCVDSHISVVANKYAVIVTDELGLDPIEPSPRNDRGVTFNLWDMMEIERGRLKMHATTFAIKPQDQLSCVEQLPSHQTGARCVAQLVTIGAVRNVLGSTDVSPVHVALLQLRCLVCVLTRHLELARRSFPGLSQALEQLKALDPDFVDTLQKSESQFRDQLLPVLLQTKSCNCTRISDLFDQSLLLPLVLSIANAQPDSALSNTLAVSVDVEHEWESLWAEAASGASPTTGGNSSLWKSVCTVLSQFAESCGGALATMQQIADDERENSSLEGLQLFHFEPNSFVQQVTGDIAHYFKPYESSHATMDSRLRFEDHHTHSKRLIEDPDVYSYKTRAEKAFLKSSRYNPARAAQRAAASKQRIITSMLDGQPVTELTIPGVQDEAIQKQKREAALARLNRSECDQQNPEPAKQKKHANQPKQSKQKHSKPNKMTAEDIRRKNKDEKNKADLDKVTKKLERVSTQATTEKDLLKQLQQIQACLSDSASLLATLETLQRQLVVLADFAREFKFGVQAKKQALLCAKRVLTIQKRDDDVVSAENLTQLAECMELYGFAEIADTCNLLLKELGAKPPKPSKAKHKVRASCPIVFQLRHMGEHLTRPTGVGDSRVPFQLDPWQQHVLDIVDARESALVVAPTSSGKTFISYYIMEQILRESNDGVVVFVAPTKALVQQVVNEATARFKKPGYCVVGQFTREFRENVFDCQVLVTVPACLVILALGSKTQKWLSKIRFLILDEFHSINDESSGHIWEQLVTLVDCPILCQTATLGDSNHVGKWLTRLHQKRNRRLHFVQHNTRWNDIKPFMISMESCDDEDTDDSERQPELLMKEISPFAVLGEHSLNDFRYDLLPTDCLDLLEQLKKTLGAAAVAHLEPQTFLLQQSADSHWNLTREHVRSWSAALKEKLRTALQSTSTTETARAVISAHCQKMALEAEPAQEIDIFSLCQLLEKKDLLPCIVFRLIRSDCAWYAFEMQKILAKAQEDSRPPNFNSRVEIVKQDIATLQRRVAGFKTSSSLEQTQEQEQVRASLQEREMDLERLVNGVDPKFTFTPAGVTPPSQDEIAEHFKNGWDPESYPIQKALERGIGYHHGGLSRQERLAVECLFRTRRLGVIFATGTLALGINMPCKASVILGDSPFLTPLLYHQMAGRAGRRGKDLQGAVIFAGLPFPRVQQLMTASLPNIIGCMPSDSSFVLRGLCLWAQIEDDERKRFAKKWLTMLETPLMAYHGPLSDLQTKLSFRYCCDYLARCNLLDPQGIPKGLSTLASHLWFLEPANLVLVSLLDKGLLNDIYDNNLSEIDQDWQLMVVLCHLFERLPLLRQTKERSSSVVKLPELPASIKDHIMLLNQEGLRSAAQYWACFWQSQAKATLGNDNKLPISGLEWSVSTVPVNPTTEPAHPSFVAASFAPQLRSSFLALSKPTDRFESVLEMTLSLRDGMLFDPSLVPIFQPADDLNAYIYDYFKHGDTRAIAEENCVNDERFFAAMQDFTLAVIACSAALERRVEIEAGEWNFGFTPKVVAGFRRVSDKLKERMATIYL